MAPHDQNMEQEKNKHNQDPNRTQSSGMGGSTSQQSGKQPGTQQGTHSSQSGSTGSSKSGGSGSDRR
ncbi:MAG TPA: hypothetical protein VN734_06300 [Acidobacteriaceae bacterium]|nr:hypothetical protein [Acidobacteriaceae bacterium]